MSARSPIGSRQLYISYNAYKISRIMDCRSYRQLYGFHIFVPSFWSCLFSKRPRNLRGGQQFIWSPGFGAQGPARGYSGYNRQLSQTGNHRLWSSNRESLLHILRNSMLLRFLPLLSMSSHNTCRSLFRTSFQNIYFYSCYTFFSWLNPLYSVYRGGISPAGF